MCFVFKDALFCFPLCLALPKRWPSPTDPRQYQACPANEPANLPAKRHANWAANSPATWPAQRAANGLHQWPAQRPAKRHANGPGNAGGPCNTSAKSEAFCGTSIPIARE
eukprot:gene15027-biopygen18670